MSEDEQQQIAGVINLFKPAGFSSAQYVYRLRRILCIRRVGHAGTLDPFAEGVLLGCVGRATKLVERLMALPKVYLTTIRLGVTNATFDTEQPFEPMGDGCPASRDALEAALAAIRQSGMQTPPNFSAVRIGGRSSYKLAKQGVPVSPAPRPVRIDELTVEAYEWPALRLRILCGRGTYIRAIARDLGERLRCGACCETLLREAVGPFRASEAVDLTTASEEAIRGALIPLPQALLALETYQASG